MSSNTEQIQAAARKAAERIADLVGFDVDVQDANGTTITTVIIAALATATDDVWERAKAIAPAAARQIFQTDDDVTCEEWVSNVAATIEQALEAARKE